MIQKIKAFLFENKTLKQTVVKNAFWLSFGQFAGRLIRVVLIIFTARVLSAAGYGVFSYALGLSAFFTIFSDIGISTILTRETSRNPELTQKYFSTALTLKVILVFFSIFLILFLAPLFTRIPEVLPLLPIAALLLAADGLREFTYAISRAKERMQVEAGINILTNIIITAIGLFVLLIAPTPRNLILGYVIGSTLGLIVSIWILRPYFHYPWRYFDKTLVKKILVEAWPFALMGLLGGIMINTDIIMLGWFKNASDVGFYSAAQRPVQLMYLFPGIMATSLFPTFSRLATTDVLKFRMVFEKSIKIVMLFALPVILGSVLLAPDIMTFLYGAPYAAAASTFSLLMLTLFAILPGTLTGNAVFAFNRQRSFVGYLTIGAVGNAVFNYLLIPPLGIVGAALATIIAQFLANGFTWRKLKTITDFQTARHLGKGMIAAFLMAGFTWGLKILGVPLLLNIGASALVYGSLLLLFKESIFRDLKSAFQTS